MRFGVGWSSLLPAELAAEAVTPQAARPVGHIGFGWCLDHTGEIIGHPGSAVGGSASLVVLRGDRQAHAALANRQVPVEPVNGRILRSVHPI